MLSFCQKIKIIPIIVLVIALILIIIAVFPVTNGGVKIEKSDEDVNITFIDLTKIRITGQYNIVSDMAYSFDDVHFIIKLKNDDETNDILEKGPFTIPAKSTYEIPFDITEEIGDILPFIVKMNGHYYLKAQAEIQGEYFFDLFDGDIVLDVFVKLSLSQDSIDMMGIE